MKKYIDAAFAVMGILLTGFFGELDGVFITLIVFVVIDYITGFTAGLLNGNLSSQIGFRGIIKKILIFVLVGIAHLVDVNVLNDCLLRNVVIFFYLSNEGLSILENILAIGLPVPEELKNILEKIGLNKNKQKNNKD